MACVYILYSANLNKYYIGSCLDLPLRLEQHRNNVFLDCFTAKENDWELFFEMPGLEYLQARNIENHIKRMKSAVYIGNLKKYPEMEKKLREKY